MKFVTNRIGITGHALSTRFPLNCTTTALSFYELSAKFDFTLIKPERYSLEVLQLQET